MAAYVTYCSLRMTVLHHIRVPLWDHWLELLPDEVLSQPLAQHNEHRILFGRLFFALDTWLANSRGYVNLTVIVVSLAATAVLIAWTSAQGPWGSRTFVPVCAFGIAALLAGYSWENLLWSFQASYVGVCPFAVGAFVAIARPGASPASLVAALACAFVAAYSLASGVLVAPIALVVAVLVRRPWHHIRLFAFVAALWTIRYLTDYETPGHHADPSRSLQDPTSILRYATVYFGAPITSEFGGAQIRVANIVGGVGLVAWVLLVVASVKDRKRLDGAAWVLLATSTFAVGWGFLTAAGRSNFPIEFALASRYGTPALLFWCALVGEAWRRSHRLPFRLAAGTAAMLIAGQFAIGQEKHESVGKGWADRFRDADTALLVGALEESVVARIAPAPYLVEHALPELRRRRHNVFADPWFAWLGTSLSRHVHARDDAACIGYLDAGIAVPALRSPAFRVEGWAYARDAGDPVQWLAIVDPEGVVVGLARGGFWRRDVALAMNVAGNEWTGFVGHVGSLSAPSVPVRAVALLDQGRVACYLRNHATLTQSEALALVKE